GLDEQIALVDGKTASLREDEYMVVRVVDGIPRGLPESAGETLRRLVDEAAALPPGTQRMPVEYGGRAEEISVEPGAYRCDFDPKDLVIGGSAQRGALLSLLANAHRRFIVHSTFLDAARFADLIDPIREACRNGVTFDLLWGADEEEGGEKRNGKAAAEIAKVVREDRELRGRFKVHMRSTGSHAKLLLCDTPNGNWVAAVGSCNWLSSPFQAVELTAILRDQHAVADVATALQQLVGRRGVLDDIATEMHVTARDLRRLPAGLGQATVSIVMGATHDKIIREASGRAARRFVVGSNRLGSTARPGAIMQGEAAAARPGVAATVMYAYPSGPLKNRHARALADEAALNGVRLLKTKIPLHGKFVAWDDDDIVVTSLNWASASCDADFPWGEIGIRISGPGIAANAFHRLAEIYPQLEGVAEEE
ncbi:MAG: phospholipase D-like domain-containing protein, partial [Ignavibacteriales bacterium]